MIEVRLSRRAVLAAPLCFMTPAIAAAPATVAAQTLVLFDNTHPAAHHVMNALATSDSNDAYVLKKEWLLRQTQPPENIRPVAELVTAGNGAFIERFAKAPIINSQPIAGDRIQLARALFAAPNAPAAILGISRYADFLLLDDVAREYGFTNAGPANAVAQGLWIWGLHAAINPADRHM